MLEGNTEGGGGLWRSRAAREMLASEFCARRGQGQGGTLEAEVVTWATARSRQELDRPKPMGTLDMIPQTMLCSIKKVPARAGGPGL